MIHLREQLGTDLQEPRAGLQEFDESARTRRKRRLLKAREPPRLSPAPGQAGDERAGCLHPSASVAPLYIATVAHLSPTAYWTPRGTGCRTILITGYSSAPVVRSVNTARVKGERETTFDGFTQPKRKRSLTRTQYKRFSASVS